MLQVENLTFRYSKFSRPVLNGASLELKPGEIGILLGPLFLGGLQGIFTVAIGDQIKRSIKQNTAAAGSAKINSQIMGHSSSSL